MDLKPLKFERVALFRSELPGSGAAAERLERDLRAAGISVIARREDFAPESVDLVLLLGGDGFLMDSLRGLGYPPTPVFGVNFGSVGFLMNPRQCLEGLVGLLRDPSRLGVEEHPVLAARVRHTDGREEAWLAVNDVVLERTGGQSVRMTVTVDGVLLNRYSGDGLIVATSAGSTAYNLAAGGPVVHPRIPAIVVTPLYPHRAAPFRSLQFPIVLPLGSTLVLSGQEVEKRPIRLLADGRPVEGLSELTVHDSGLRLHLLRVESHEFVATLARKFIGED